MRSVVWRDFNILRLRLFFRVLRVLGSLWRARVMADAMSASWLDPEYPEDGLEEEF